MVISRQSYQAIRWEYAARKWESKSIRSQSFLYLPLIMASGLTITEKLALEKASKRVVAREDTMCVGWVTLRCVATRISC